RRRAVDGRDERRLLRHAAPADRSGHRHRAGDRAIGRHLSIDIARLRKRFPALAHKHYLNSGSYRLLSGDVKQAFEEYLACRDERGSDWGEWAMRDDAVRTRMARLLNASADEIAITTSASAGINSLVTALDFGGPRNKVVVSDFEFPTSGQIW